MTETKRPIFIVSVGRSGSSIYHELLSHHPRIAWLSGLCDRFPEMPGLNRAALGLTDLPLVGGLARRMFSPEECYAFWDHHSPGFSTPFRDLRADDVTRSQRDRIRTALGQLVTRGRDRLLVKLTGWPRIGFLHEIFPDARFVHIVRDGRAVVNSILQVDWWWGWRGMENWRFGPLSEVDRRDFERHRGSFVALAAIQWRLLLDAVERARSDLPEGVFLEVRYEDLCEDPLRVARETLDFCGLDPSSLLEERIRATSLESRNDKWRTELTEAQQGILRELMGPRLARYGYR